MVTPIVAVTLAVIALFLYFALRAGRGVVFVFAIAYLIAIAGLVASAFVYPAPLPVAEVVPKEGAPPVSGDFVGEDGGVWYVADFESDEVRAFNLLNVEEASFSSRERDHTTLLDAFD
jgi:hypothetical protein